MTPEQVQKVKELHELRRILTHENVNHRAAKSRCKSTIETLRGKIKLEQLDMQKKDESINNNQRKIEEAGREIQSITGQSIIKWNCKNETATDK